MRLKIFAPTAQRPTGAQYRLRNDYYLQMVVFPGWRPPPARLAHQNQLIRGFLLIACDVGGSGLVRRVQETHEDHARRPLLTRISVKLIFMCETTDTVSLTVVGENGVGEALYSLSVSYRLSEA